jgi:PAS domain S-box-containing protein
MARDPKSEASRGGEDHLLGRSEGTDAAHARSEERFRALVRALSSLVWTSAPDGQIIDMPEWRALTGMTVDEVRGWGWLNSLHPDDRARTAVVWQAAIDARSYYETEYRIRRWDGQYAWYQSRGVPVLENDGTIREWVGCLIDIEDRKRAAQQQAAAEKALRVLNETLEQRVEAETRERARIWNVSQDLLAVIDKEGKYLSVNPAWTETLGWSEADLVGNTYGSLLHPSDRENTYDELTRLFEGHRMPRFENRLRHKDGTYRRLSWTAVPDRGLVYAVGRDVTELKNAEEQLRESRRELGRVNRRTTMGEMTVSIAHEINQPLAAIVMNADAGLQWLTNEKPDLDQVRTILRAIGKDGLRAGEVIASIRSMFGKGRPEMSAVDVTAILGNVLALVYEEFERHQISVKNETLNELPPVLAERGQLQQVFLNLFTNAIDAMSSITDRARVLTIKSRLGENDGVLITLEDSGIGIDASHLDRIFDAFFTTKADGMGMGLSICRSIIESHGGQLSAKPGDLHGTVFQIVLPTAPLPLLQSSGMNS